MEMKLGDDGGQQRVMKFLKMENKHHGSDKSAKACKKILNTRFCCIIGSSARDRKAVALVACSLLIRSAS